MPSFTVGTRCDTYLTSDETQQIEPDLHQALSDFCSSISALQDERLEPPSKRRRLESSAVSVPSEQDSNGANYSMDHLTLIDSRIILEALQEGPPSPQSPISLSGLDSFPVLISSCQTHTEEDGSETVKLILTLPSGKKTPSVTLVIQTGSDNEMYEHLSYAFRLPRPKTRSSQFRRSDICWTDCCLEPSFSGSSQFELHIKVYWTIGVPAVSWLSSRDSLPKPFLDTFLDHKISSSGPWSPYDFYSNVHVPNAFEQIPSAVQNSKLQCDLYPFQQRAVSWLLRREGVRFNEFGELESLEAPDYLPTSFEVRDVAGQSVYASTLLLEARTKLNESHCTVLKGGILAEEMGLGKTVELIALILAHQRTDYTTPKLLDEYSNSIVRPSAATLIITPPAILEQWISELSEHAPNLKAYHYRGLKESKLDDMQMRDELLQQDVILTTYNVLSREIHYADDKPKREMRQSKKYKAPRSPLISIQWWRVCLDEAQMIESGVSNAAKVACLIPRCNAWAVSGTPLKKDVTDLLGLLVFLRCQPFCDKEIWKRLVSTHKYVLAEICQLIALRHTKSKIRDELVLPPQKRIVITVPFTATEEQNYNNLFRQMCDECGLHEDGSPVDVAWDPNSPAVIEKMRSWLTRLRQTCLHAGVGTRNRRALGARAGTLRTVDEVLEVMINNHEATIRVKEREALSRKIICGHFYAYGKASKQALECFLSALEETQEIVKECREQLRTEKIKAAQEKGNADEESEESDSDDAATEEKKGRLGSCRSHLRSALELLHSCYFFAGTAYFQVKDDPILTHPASTAFGELETKEVECYDEAKLIRKELLREVTKKTTRLIDKVASTRADSLLKLSEVADSGVARGLESRKFTDKMERLRTMLNDQAKQFEEWRSKLIDTLVEKLLDQDDEVEMTGEEYEKSTTQQSEQYALLEALRCVHSDRQCMITGQIGTLVNHEMKAAFKQASGGTTADPENKGPAPELIISIMAARESFNPPENIQATLPTQAVNTRSVSLRGVMTEIRQAITSVQWSGSDRSKVESQILEQELGFLQRTFNALSKELATMEKEIDLLRSTMNQRLEFYRSLQHISDTVAPFREVAEDTVDYESITRESINEDNIRQQLSTLKTKRRFLVHLQNTKDGNSQQEKYCVICQNTFETGVLTVCGHQYCKDCIRLWWVQHKNCPMCKTHLSRNDFHDITYKPKELRAHEETSAPDSAGESQSPTKSSPSKAAIYADINRDTLDEIQNIELPESRSYSVKIDTLARHIYWLRQRDPGTQSVIFSQYRDFLTTLAEALQVFKIRYTEIGSKAGIKRFREDPSIECFLLHAKAESSGLTLVNAAHVFLCEPLINTAIELQAIARVHRIGQKRSTQVWVYLVSNTVEEAIYDISISRRLAHMGQSTLPSRPLSRERTPHEGATSEVQERKLDDANSFELQTAPISKLLTKESSGGEVVANDDLWNCLFSKHKPNQQATSGALENLTSREGPAAREIGSHLRAEAAEDRRSAT